VPLFFFVNGALLLNRRELCIKKHTFNCLKIFGLIVIWSFITIAVLTYLWTDFQGIKGFLRNLFIHENIFAFVELKRCWNNHLWFLIALFIIYVFYPIIYVAFKSNKRFFYFFFFATMIFTFLNTFIGDIVSAVKYFNGNFQDYHYFNYGYGYNPFQKICGYGLGYFMLGGLLFENKEKLFSNKLKLFSLPIILLSTICMFFWGYIMSKGIGRIWDVCFNGYNTVFTLINVVCVFVIFLNYQVKSFIGKFISLIGQHSLGIYFIHISVGTLCMNYWYRWEVKSLFLNILLGMVILIASFLISLLISKIPYIRKIATI
jgi:surface polysaccharide O-acyltransferase-like enzyme